MSFDVQFLTMAVCVKDSLGSRHVATAVRVKDSW